MQALDVHYFQFGFCHGLYVCTYILTVYVFLARIQGQSYGIGHVQMTAFRKFDQHWQICTIKDAPILRLTGQQAQVGRRSTEQVGDHHDAVTCINCVCGFADFTLLGSAIMVSFDGDGAHAGLSAYDMFYRTQIFTSQSAMGHDHDTDQS